MKYEVADVSALRSSKSYEGKGVGSPGPIARHGQPAINNAPVFIINSRAVDADLQQRLRIPRPGENPGACNAELLVSVGGVDPECFGDLAAGVAQRGPVVEDEVDGFKVGVRRGEVADEEDRDLRGCSANEGELRK